MKTIETTEPLVISRLIKAPRERVFEAWTTPELAQWLCPGERRVVSSKVDPRVGGSYAIHLETDDGPVTFGGTYLEIHKPAQIVFSWNIGDCLPEYAGHVSQVTVDLVEEKGGTRLTLTHEGLPNAEVAGKHANGWNGSLDNLEKRV